MGIGAAIAVHLARDGWDVATTFWRPYDETMPHGSDPADVGRLHEQLAACGARTALVLAHCHSVDSDILETTTASFDRHFAVNARASWLLVREFGRRFRTTRGRGRIVALTSDHVAGNLPYGASKGALDRIVLAAAREFRDLGIKANVVNPGPTDTGWMTNHQRQAFSRQSAGGRVGLPEDCANLVRFLCSAAGGWINDQLLRSDGGR